MKRKIVVFIMAFALIFTTAFSVSLTDSNAATPKPKAISLATTSSNVDIGGTVTVRVSAVSPSNASKSVKWKTSNKKIATVSSKGVVVGKKKGTVKITATSTKNRRAKRTITIYVKDLKPTAIVLNKTSMELYAGKTGYISSSLRPSYGLRDLGTTWTSSDKGIATIPKAGNSRGVTIAAVGEGLATITARTKESARTATCNVIVKNISFANPGKKTVYLGDNSLENAATVTPEEATLKEVTYSSSNEDVAEVDSNGKIRTRSQGTTTITATAKDDSRATVSYECVVKGSNLKGTENGANVEYNLDRQGYSAYKVIGYRAESHDELESIIDEGALDNAFGDNGSVNVWSATSVYEEFLGSSFSFSTGEYEVSKAANDGVCVKYKTSSGTPTTSYWYYRNDDIAKSMLEPTVDGAYTLTLFSTASGEYSKSLVVNLENNTITFSVNHKDITIIKDATGKQLTLDVQQSGEPRINFTFEKNDDGTVYKLIVPKTYDDQYKLQIIPWVLK